MINYVIHAKTRRYVVSVYDKMAEEDDDSNNFVSPLHRDPGAFSNAGGNKDEESTSIAPHRVNIIFDIGPPMHETMACPGTE